MNEALLVEDIESLRAEIIASGQLMVMDETEADILLPLLELPPSQVWVIVVGKEPPSPGEPECNPRDPEAMRKWHEWCQAEQMRLGGNQFDPDLSPQPVASLSAPADCRSVDKSTAPLKPEHRSLEFADVRIKAQERGLNLTQTEHGYRLQNKHGAIVRKQLGELLEVINHSPKDGK